MEIALHIGANCTDEDRLIRTLIKNGSILESQGIKAPGPSKYRRLLRETIQSLGGAAAAPGTREHLIAAMSEGQSVDRLVLSNSNFICLPNRIFENGIFYEQADIKLYSLRQIFPHDDLDLYLGIRNPSTFLADAYAKSNAPSFSEFMYGVDPMDVSWSNLIRRIMSILPNTSLTVWCNEDTPLIWDELIWSLSGLPTGSDIKGGHDLLSTIMSDEGMHRYLSYMSDHPPRTITQKRRVISAFLDKYALNDKLVETIDLPGLSALDIQDMSEAYDEDVARIAEIPGLRLITI